jgi:hypothetical protein
MTDYHRHMHSTRMMIMLFILLFQKPQENVTFEKQGVGGLRPARLARAATSIESPDFLELLEAAKGCHWHWHGLSVAQALAASAAGASEMVEAWSRGKSGMQSS